MNLEGPSGYNAWVSEHVHLAQPPAPAFQGVFLLRGTECMM